MVNRTRNHQRKKGSSSTLKLGTIIVTLLLSSQKFQKGSSASATAQQDSSYDQIQNSSSCSSVAVVDDDDGDEGHDIGRSTTEEERQGSLLSPELEAIDGFENHATATSTAASIYQSPSSSPSEEEEEIDESAFDDKHSVNDTQIQAIATDEDDNDDGEDERKRTKKKRRRKKKVRQSDNEIQRRPKTDSRASTRSSKRKRISVRFTPAVFQSQQQVDPPPPKSMAESSSSQQQQLASDNNDNNNRHDSFPRVRNSNSLMYYVPIILERSFLLFGLAAIAVLKFDHSSLSTAAGSAVKNMHISVDPTSAGAAVATTATKTTTTTSFLGRIKGNLKGGLLARFLGSISFEWKTLWLKANDVLPSLTSALLLVWVPQLISSRAWWDLGTLVGMPVLLSITSPSPSSSLYSLSLWIQQKLYPSMIKMIHNVIWKLVFGLAWDYVFRPFPTHPEEEEEEVDVDVSRHESVQESLSMTVETHQSSSSSSFVSWVEDWNNRAVNAGAYLWGRIHSKMNRMTQTLLQRPFEQQLKLSIIGMLIPDDSKPSPPPASRSSSSGRRGSSSVSSSSSSDRTGGGKPMNLPLRP